MYLDSSVLADMFHDVFTWFVPLFCHFLNLWCLEDLILMKFVLLFFSSFRVVAFCVLRNLCLPQSCEDMLYVFFQKLHVFVCMFFSTGWANIWDSFSHGCVHPVIQHCMLKDFSFHMTLSRCLHEGLFLEFLVCFYNLLFNLMPIPCCVDYGSFISLEIRQFEFGKFFLQIHIFLNLKANNYFGIRR